MTYNIILVALEKELPYKHAPRNCKVIYTGVGKVNAAYAATQAIAEAHSLGWHPQVINYGTAGSCKQDLSGLHRVTRFIQRDMDAEPQAPRGVVPFEAGYPYLEFTPEDGIKLGTGDSFVHKLDKWLVDQDIDLVDMEAYAIAHVCKRMKCHFTCYKYVTDYVGTPHQNDVWEANVANGIQDFLKVYDEQH